MAFMAPEGARVISLGKFDMDPSQDFVDAATGYDEGNRSALVRQMRVYWSAVAHQYPLLCAPHDDKVAPYLVNFGEMYGTHVSEIVHHVVAWAIAAEQIVADPLVCFTLPINTTDILRQLGPPNETVAILSPLLLPSKQSESCCYRWFFEGLYGAGLFSLSNPAVVWKPHNIWFAFIGK